METGICRRCGCNWITPCLDDDCGALSETYLETPIEDIELSVRTYNCLKRAGKNTLGDISSMTIDELKHTKISSEEISDGRKYSLLFRYVEVEVSC